MPAGDFPLYAKWTEPVYEVSFDLNGADLAEQADPDAYDDQQVKKERLLHDRQIRCGKLHLCRMDQSRFSLPFWNRDHSGYDSESQMDQQQPVYTDL